MAVNRSRIVNFSSKAIAKQLLDSIVAEQNARLIDYAKKKIIEIGNKVMTYHSKNHMDRTGNLLNSLVWGVSYYGKLVDGGFFRDAVLRSKGIALTSESFLHEWFSGDEKYLTPVDGRALATDYMQKYGNNGRGDGWKVFFAILAPYWGYWEKGFRMTHGSMTPKDSKGEDSKAYKSGVRSFYKFAVMTQYYDEISRDLKPARTRFRVILKPYSHSDIIDKWNKKEGID